MLQNSMNLLKSSILWAPVLLQAVASAIRLSWPSWTNLNDLKPFLWCISLPTTFEHNSSVQQPVVCQTSAGSVQVYTVYCHSTFIIRELFTTTHSEQRATAVPYGSSLALRHFRVELANEPPVSFYISSCAVRASTCMGFLAKPLSEAFVWGAIWSLIIGSNRVIGARGRSIYVRATHLGRVTL